MLAVELLPAVNFTVQHPAYCIALRQQTSRKAWAVSAGML
jgi:hypothetical protein